MPDQTPDFIPAAPQNINVAAVAPSPQSAPDFIPALPSQAVTSGSKDFISTDEASSNSPAVSDPDESSLGKIWNFASKPLLDLHRENAGPIESGVENLASALH